MKIQIILRENPFFLIIFLKKKKNFYTELEINQITLSDYMNQNEISKIDFLV